MSKYITEILLKNFRNHLYYNAVLKKKHVLFFGQNGVGKTSILEAISKLAPGLGIKSAKNLDIARDFINPWELHFKFTSDSSVGIGFDLNQKVIKIDGKYVKSASALLDVIKVIWFTPQMDGIFTFQKKERQRFFDRIIANFDVNHLENLVTYEKLKKQRKELLLQIADPDWLDIIEEKLAQLCFLLTKSREKGIAILQDNINSNNFLKTQIKLDCNLALICTTDDKSLAIKTIKDAFRANRQQDRILKKTSFGAHLADFFAIHPKSSTRSNFCSTGEQKSILLSVLIACSKSFNILLLDDVSSHIDECNLSSFLSQVLNQNCQVFLTDLSLEKFSNYFDIVDFIELKH